MELLKCDVCEGKIIVQAGGQQGVCENCGALYSIERLKEMLGIEVTGDIETPELIQQWEKLLSTYMESYDYEEANKVVKKILEAHPENVLALKAYRELQVLKDMHIKNCVFVKYDGKASELFIPEGITEIWKEAFIHTKLDKVVLPKTLTKIGTRAFEHQNFKKIELPEGLIEIGPAAFSECRELREIVFPTSIRKIWDNAFQNCKKLKKVVFKTEEVEMVTNYSREAGIFKGCDKLSEVVCSEEFLNVRSFSGTPFESKIREKWLIEGRCSICGGKGEAVTVDNSRGMSRVKPVEMMICTRCGNKWKKQNESEKK